MKKDSNLTANVDSDKSSGIPSDLSNQKVEPPKPVYLESPINGKMLEEKDFNAIKNRPVLAVMIQNNTASRPEFGLNEADVVYETLAEGGITRFMGVFWSQDAAKVMSLRSARKYFVDLLGDYNNPLYMHIGYAEGADNVNAIKAIRTYGIRALENAGGAFSRDKACERVKNTEHCAFSSTATLWGIAEKNGWKGDISKLQPWKFKDAGKETATAKDVTDVRVNFNPLNSLDYDVIWRYNKDTNKYLRFNANGTPYNDGNGKQVETDVVVYQKINSFLSGDSKGHVVQDVIGSGTGYVLQGGKSYPVSWKKPNFATRTKFSDTMTNEEFTFTRGRQWIMLVSKANDMIDNTPKPSPTATPAAAQ
jgi:hypothetical protein